MSGKKLEKNTLLCCGIFALYAVLTFIGALNHELWFDEAQAWVIVRDNDINGIFRAMSYEGHPPLWYMILYIPAHLGLPCTVMPYISWVITAFAGAVIMFKAPFHVVTRTAVLFSGGFLFLNSVISRVYCLVNLLVVLIAWLYPKRKKYPVLYGLLVALLANTHICMSGFVGIIGIFMIIDLFSGFRAKETKQKIKEITGLAVSGAGVLIMMIPLLDSLSLNSTASGIELSAGEVANSFLGSFLNNSLSMLDYGMDFQVIRTESIGEGILSGFMAAAFVVMIIIMRHKTRPFFMLLFFWIFYTITTEVFWVTMPNRAVIFALMYFIVIWTAEYEPQNNASAVWSKIDLNTDTKAIKKLIGFIETSDKNFRRSYTAIITAVMLVSVPTGAYYLFSDYVKPFSLAEETVEYIQNNFPEDSVIATYSDSGYAQISAYMPEIRFYSLYYGRFYTFCSNETISEAASTDKIYNDLKDQDNIYFLYACSNIEFQSTRKMIHIIRGGMPYGANGRYVEFSEFVSDEEHIEKIKSAF